jgi:hypothetical protein
MRQIRTFDDLVEHAKERYRSLHRGETEGRHYDFSVQRAPDGKSGHISVRRLEDPPMGTVPRAETLLIEENKVVLHQTEITDLTWWLGEKAPPR